MIDWARVNDLRSEIGEDDFLEVVAMFLEEADEAVGRLTGPPNLLQVENQLHFLKGAALSLGLTDLAAVCQAGERSAALGNAGIVDLAQVAQIYRTSRRMLSGGIHQLAR